MSNTVRVAPEDLMVSASTVDAHADGMWLTHGTATSRIEGAQKGVPPAANVALSAAVAKWQADSTALFGRLVDHGHALRAGAAVYEQTDGQNAENLKAAGDQMTALDLGL
ncbi:hypothetical protein AU189_03025 [Mycolicibacterium acapulense]|uniref:ESX-1 secretion-associated protein n=2 Tax=Mycobacterium lehmannii TaxID=2048550 RepID=A0A101ABF6_9MYCO|nr:hypothetical protein [Mycobacterium lehmannii]KUI05358.1 hypothetical protein AU189_03025 [Mycolicibacterium acapulense]KUI16134.1 hypothetical protein AU191_00935 [Mycolicibacterium acapulense]KUI19689.1 hypothetical protein AU192_01670 [Mycobacterium lehmannii]